LRKKKPSLPKFGNLPPKYRFILNPYWRKREKEPVEFGNVQEHVHDFKEYLNVKYIPAYWEPANEK